MDIDRRMKALRHWQRLLDSAYRIPGTSIRFGWDPIVGLVPWVGDVVAALLSSALMIQAFQSRVPRLVQLRMLLNIAIDFGFGLIPIAGNVADVFWKANSRNMALLERHVSGTRQATTGDWLFVAGVAFALAAMIALPFVFLYWVTSSLIHTFR